MGCLLVCAATLEITGLVLNDFMEAVRNARPHYESWGTWE